MEAPCFVRRRKTAAERRSQRHRSEARFLQRALDGLNDVHAHRGGTLTRFGMALRESLSRFSRGTEVPPPPAVDPSVPAPSPHYDASSAPFHVGPAVEPSAAHSSDIADAQNVLLAFPEVAENVDAAVDMPLQFPEPSSSDVHLATVQVSSGVAVEPLVVPELSCPDVQVASVCHSGGTGDDPDVVLPQQLFGKDGIEAVSDMIPVGQEVFSRHMDVFYPATITAHNEDGTYGIRFFDGLIVNSASSADISMDPGCSAYSDNRASLIGLHADDATGGGVKHDCNQQ